MTAMNISGLSSALDISALAGQHRTVAARPQTPPKAHEVTAEQQPAPLNTHVGDWDAKLAGQMASLHARFSAMETALSKLRSASGYLTSVGVGVDAPSPPASRSASSSPTYSRSLPALSTPSTG
jgi:hypothetical protein